MAEVIKTEWACWHGTYVAWKRIPPPGHWWHPNSKTDCDDPAPMRKQPGT